jgi:hypothetical protein
MLQRGCTFVCNAAINAERQNTTANGFCHTCMCASICSDDTMGYPMASFSKLRCVVDHLPILQIVQADVKSIRPGIDKGPLIFGQSQ